MRLAAFRLLIIAAVIFIDQWSKSTIISFIEEYERSRLLGFLDFTLIFNKGIAFSLFDYQSGMQTLPLIILSVFAILFFTFLLLRNPWSKVEEAGILFIIGGAIGNLIDRIIQGAVTDFILFYYNDFYFPAFNLADSFITIGILMLLIAEFLNQEKKAV